MIDNQVFQGFSAILLAVLLLISGWARKVALTPPNGPWKTSETNDTISTFSKIGGIISLLLKLFGLGTILHAIASITYPSISTNVCPYPKNLDPAYFMWSIQTTLYSSLIILGGYIRFVSYKQLGTDFTYEISVPTRGLVKSGLYRHVQHPSYPALFISFVFSQLLFAMPTGLLGCFIPPDWATSPTLWLAAYAYAWTPMMLVIVVRLPEEERFLKKTFGKEWEEYHAKTARFIPFVW